MDGKVALLTGATSGIGKAAAEGLKREGAHVIVLARDPTMAQGFEGVACDLSSQASVRKAAAEVLAKHPKIDVLVLSAGVFLKQRSETVDGIERTFAVNYLSHFLLVNLLRDALTGGRVVFVASRYGGAKIDFDDLMLKRKKFSIMTAVPPTKLAEVLLAQELAERWRDRGVRVNAVHPGLVANTKLLDEVGGFFRFLTNLLGTTPEKGADTILWLATSGEAEHVTGQLLAKRKPVPTPGQGSDPAARKRLWQESERLAATG